ncbi:MAG: hypothetical protein HF312_02685 [Ignavibacteria bacterium]|jgi:hypothetical protein|nr:hypothetical protein [Ignavibacteria bacterium]MCU7519092.1 hypothetical protein [Ignavibacteria bacterium]
MNYSSFEKKSRWYDNIIIILGLSFIFPPLGLVLLFRFKDLTYEAKIPLAIAAIVCFYMVLKPLVLDPIEKMQSEASMREADYYRWENEVNSKNLNCPFIGIKGKHHKLHECYYLPEEIDEVNSYISMGKSDDPSRELKYNSLSKKLEQIPVMVEDSLVVKYGDYLKNKSKYLAEKSMNDKKLQEIDDAKSILSGMEVLTSRIDRGADKYYIIHQLWESADSDKRYQLMQSVADAHAVIEKKATKIQFIDDLTGKKIAEASPTWGIRVFN